MFHKKKSFIRLQRDSYCGGRHNLGCSRTRLRSQSQRVVLSVNANCEDGSPLTRWALATNHQTSCSDYTVGAVMAPLAGTPVTCYSATLMSAALLKGMYGLKPPRQTPDANLLS